MQHSVGACCNYSLVSTFQFMENSALFLTLLLSCLLLSITSYSIYMGFGPPAKKLRDPFEEHED